MQTISHNQDKKAAIDSYIDTIYSYHFNINISSLSSEYNTDGLLSNKIEMLIRCVYRNFPKDIHLNCQQFSSSTSIEVLSKNPNIIKIVKEKFDFIKDNFLLIIEHLVEIDKNPNFDSINNILNNLYYRTKISQDIQASTTLPSPNRTKI